MRAGVSPVVRVAGMKTLCTKGEESEYTTGEGESLNKSKMQCAGKYDGALSSPYTLQVAIASFSCV